MTTENLNGKSESRLWWTRLLSRRLQFLLDVAVLVAAFSLAYFLRFDFAIPPEWLHKVLVQLPYVVLLQFAALNLAGGRSFIWRYTSITHVRSFLYAASVSFLIILSLRFGLPEGFQQWRAPLSVNIIATLLAFGGALGLRIFRRSL